MGHILGLHLDQFEIPSQALICSVCIKTPNLENAKRKIYGADNHVIPENMRVTESNTLEQKGKMRSIH